MSPQFTHPSVPVIGNGTGTPYIIPWTLDLTDFTTSSVKKSFLDFQWKIQLLTLSIIFTF